MVVVKLLAKALAYKLEFRFPVDISSINGLLNGVADEWLGLDSVALMFGDSRHGKVQLV